MFFHIITSNTCNLNCKYCCEKAFDEPDTFPEPVCELNNKINYSIPQLKKFISKFKNNTITFYGGEPLLNIEHIKKVMDNIKNIRFMMQTNGLLLDKLPPEYTNKFHTILVSLDGDKKTTNKYRGKGTYEKVIQNLKLIRRNGFKGEIIARMTIEEQDIYNSVLHLLNNKEFPFTSVHWQLDANFWFNDWKKRNFKKLSENYNKSITKLIDFWIKEMERSRKVVKLYPFIAIMHDILHKKTTKLRCGSGHSNYTIQTDGNISPCPIMMGMKNYYFGNIKQLKQVGKGFPIIERYQDQCPACPYLSLCGGRCMYSNILNPWPKEQRKLVCGTVKHLIKTLQKSEPKIRKLITTKKVTLKDFNFLRYNGAEIIP
ncbi:MAG: TIGR04084 family radical SAM/SPASM domain-containing protein [Candidatus ainarchaeum sp.]|nr:TIGR04084 family radical SAM/SPASM domain-containing protein [Candidatus ainarchaeum sp.]